MKLLVDANILLDVLQAREPYLKDSSLIWKLCETGEVQGYASALTFANLIYIMRKQLDAKGIHDVLNTNRRRRWSGRTSRTQYNAQQQRELEQILLSPAMLRIFCRAGKFQRSLLLSFWNDTFEYFAYYVRICYTSYRNTHCSLKASCMALVHLLVRIFGLQIWKYQRE